LDKLSTFDRNIIFTEYSLEEEEEEELAELRSNRTILSKHKNISINTFLDLCGEKMQKSSKNITAVSQVIFM